MREPTEASYGPFFIWCKVNREPAEPVRRLDTIREAEIALEEYRATKPTGPEFLRFWISRKGKRND